MATVNGNDILVYVEGQAIGCLTSNEFSSTNNEIDVTCKDDDGARKVLPGGNQSSISFEGFFNPASSYGFHDLIAVHKNRTRVWVKMVLDDDPDSLAVTAYAYLNTLTWSAPLNAGSTFSGEFTIDGEWSYTTT